MDPFMEKRAIQGSGLSKIHNNLYFINITMERLQV